MKLKWVGFLLWALLCAPLALAQSPSGADVKKAKAQAAAGKSSFEAERYEEALASFQSAFGLNPKLGYLANIGQCYFSLGRYQEAIDTYQSFLDKAPAKDPLRPAVEKELSKTRQALTALKESAALSAKNTGDKAFTALEYEKALRAYQEAYSLSVQPEHLLSIAQCYAALGEDREAVASYQAFLEKAPTNDPKRDAVQEAISKLSAAPELPKTAPAKPTSTEAAIVSEPPLPPSKLPARLILGGAFSAALGGVSGSLALASAFKLRGLADLDDVSSLDAVAFDKASKRVKLLSPASDVLFATALALAGAGVFLRSKEKRAEASLSVAPGAVRLVVRY